MSGNIMTLRTMIMDNLKLLNYPELENLGFGLMRDEDGKWIVFLDRPGDPDTANAAESRKFNFVCSYRGAGATPELAYMRLLEDTADKICVAYGFGTHDESE